MDDSNRHLTTTFLVFALMAAGLAGLEFFLPSTEDASSDEAAEVAPPENETAEPAAPVDVPDEAAHESRRAAAHTATVETESYAATFTDLNSALVSFLVKGDRYRTAEGRPYEMVTTDQEAFLPLRLELGGIDIPASATWELEQVSERDVRFTLHADGFTIVRRLEPGDAPYQLWSTVRIVNDGNVTRPVRVNVTSAHYVARATEKGGMFGRPSPAVTHGVCLYGDEELVREDRESLLEGLGFGPDVTFVALSDVYFATVLASEGEPAERCQLYSSERGRDEDGDPMGSLFEVRLRYPRDEVAPGQEVVHRTAIYMGPKDYDALTAFGHRATRVVDLGFFTTIAEALTELLRLIHGLVGNWGLAIILLTVLVKLVLYPLTHKSFESMAKMRVLKPEMDRINELYADDREKKGAAIMELYRKHKINPLGGCLPSLLQLPIWFALYQSLSSNIELYHTPFIGYLTDLSAPDPYKVMPLLLGALMFLQQKLTPTTMDPAQAKIMLYLMPGMITFFMLFLPAGLCLYMVTNSTLGIAQQKLIQWRLDNQAPASSVDDEGDGVPKEPSPSSTAPKSSRSNKRQRRGR